VIRNVRTIYKKNVLEKTVYFTIVWRKAKCRKSEECLYIVYC